MSTEDDEGETCVRCGEIGEDRRTLWMACFYAMRELNVPFAEKSLYAAEGVRTVHKKVPIKVTRYDADSNGITETSMVDVPVHTAIGDGKLNERQFYTLRVCKACRSEWMQAIKAWFLHRKSEDHKTGTGAFIREFGRTREMTEEEIKERFPNGGEVRLRQP